MLQPYIDMAKERVTEPLVEDPNTDKAIKGKEIITCKLEHRWSPFSL